MYTSFTVAKQRVSKELTELQTPDTTAGTIVKVTLNQPQQRGHTTQQSGDLPNAQYGAQTTYYPSPQTFATLALTLPPPIDIPPPPQTTEAAVSTFTISIKMSTGPYSQGPYTFHLIIPPLYPFKPPKVYASTRIFHPNVSLDDGSVWLSVLGEDVWRPVMSVNAVVLAVQLMMLEPKVESGVHNPDAATILRRSLHEFNGVVRKTMGGGVYFGRTFRDLFEGGRAFSDDMSVMRGGAESQSQESQEAFFPPQLVLNHQSSLTSATSSTASSMVDGSHGDGMAVGLFTSKRKFTMEEEIEGMCLGGEEVGGGKRHKTGGGLF